MFKKKFILLILCLCCIWY